MTPTPSLVLSLGFWILPPLVFGLLTWALWRSSRARAPAAARRVGLVAGLMGAWMLLAPGLAASGALRFGSLPPRPFLLFLAGVALTVLLARSRAGIDLGRQLPLWALVGAQAFRLPLELLLHRGALDGLTPPQMTYAGYNFDVVTGASSVVVALLVARGWAPRWLVAAWNVMGMALLANVLTIAVLSMPTPLRVFTNEPANTWIASAPFVWLPTVLVPAAILGHLLVWRRLREDAPSRALSQA